MLKTFIKGVLFLYRIIVIDDHQLLRDMISETLNSQSDFQVIATSGDAKDSLELCQEYHPDLVLMDITMPEMDGIQALKKIKETDAAANVIMCSAMGQQAMVIESIQSGARDFIVKPFQPDRVIEAVKKAVG